MGQNNRRRRLIHPLDPQTFTDCMEQLQEGYVAAVAATAACSFQPVSRDTYGMDVLLVRPAAPGIEEISVYAQLKSTTTLRVDPNKKDFPYQFKKRDYFERLAVTRQNGPKAILIVMATSPWQGRWTASSHTELRVQHCCYWVSLEGRTVPAGVQSPTVRVPTKNVFDAAALTDVLDRLDRGEAIS
jgi:hypothetical protein